MLFSKKKTQEERQAELDAAFLKAVGKHKFAKAHKLLAEGANVLARDSDGNTALHKLSAHCPYDDDEWNYGSLREDKAIEEFICFLVHGGVDVNGLNKKGQTCLHTTLLGDGRDDPRTIMMMLLVKHGASASIHDSSGRTLAHVAASLGLYNFVAAKDSNGGIIHTFSQLHICPFLGTQDNAGRYPHDVAKENGHHKLSVDAKALFDSGYRGVQKVSQPQAVTGPVVSVESDKWLLVTSEEVAHISVKEALGYKLTETFNFQTRIYTQIAHNLETKADTLASKGFDDFADKTILVMAHRELVRLDGKADVGMIYRQTLDKGGLKPS